MARSEFKHAFEATGCGSPSNAREDDTEEIVESKDESLFENSEPLLREQKSIKCEEFDADDLLSDHSNEIICPASPDSQPSSPSSSDVSTDCIKIGDLCDEPELSLVGDSTYHGYRIGNELNAEEFLSCGSNDIINMCNINSLDDPFSELFPSLISV